MANVNIKSAKGLTEIAKDETGQILWCLPYGAHQVRPVSQLIRGRKNNYRVLGCDIDHKAYILNTLVRTIGKRT